MQRPEILQRNEKSQFRHLLLSPRKYCAHSVSFHRSPLCVLAFPIHTARYVLFFIQAAPEQLPLHRISLLFIGGNVRDAQRLDSLVWVVERQERAPQAPRRMLAHARQRHATHHTNVGALRGHHSQADIAHVSSRHLSARHIYKPTFFLIL